MDNNKSRLKERPKTNPELRKMDPKNNAAAGMDHQEKVGNNNRTKNQFE